ncbi:MAG: hypothetical protein ACRCX2_12665 [Paraclostridium sp.]
MAMNEQMHADAIKRRIGQAVSDINTMLVGTIVSVDPVKMKYSVQPIINEYDEIDDVHIEQAIIFECPMMVSKCSSFYIRMPYSIGDVVYLGVNKSPIAEALTSNETKNNRLLGVDSFRVVDAVILGGLLTKSEDLLSDTNKEDFLIQNRKTGCKLVMLNNGGFELVTDYDIHTKSINVNMVATGDVNIKCSNANIESPITKISGNLSVGGNLDVSGAGTIGSVTTSSGVTLDGHTHKYNPGPGAPTPTGPGEG